MHFMIENCCLLSTVTFNGILICIDISLFMFCTTLFIICSKLTFVFIPFLSNVTFDSLHDNLIIFIYQSKQTLNLPLSAYYIKVIVMNKFYINYCILSMIKMELHNFRVHRFFYWEYSDHHATWLLSYCLRRRRVIFGDLICSPTFFLFKVVFVTVLITNCGGILEVVTFEIIFIELLIDIDVPNDICFCFFTGDIETIIVAFLLSIFKVGATLKSHRQN